MNNKSVRNAIADNIRRYRKFNDLTMTELGAHFDKSASAVQAWEKGISQPDADTLVELCRILNVDLLRMCQIDSDVEEDEAEVVFALRNMDEAGRRALHKCALALAAEFPRPRTEDVDE